MNIQILDEAEQDLVDGFGFYERHGPGLGDYFLNALFADIDSLHLYAGIHALHEGYHRLLARRFPFAVYYRLSGDTVVIRAVLDCRRDPDALRDHLK